MICAIDEDNYMIMKITGLECESFEKYISNEMKTKVAELITKTKGISLRYLQGYLNFNTLRKQMKYKCK